MANKSAEHPDGVLTKSVLRAFFGITELPNGSFSGGTGREYIPDNWYKVNATFLLPARCKSAPV